MGFESTMNCCWRERGRSALYREGEVFSAKVEIYVAEFGFALHEDELNEAGFVHAIDLSVGSVKRSCNVTAGERRGAVKPFSRTAKIQPGKQNKGVPVGKPQRRHRPTNLLSTEPGRIDRTRRPEGFPALAYARLSSHPRTTSVCMYA